MLHNFLISISVCFLCVIFLSLFPTVSFCWYFPLPCIKLVRKIRPVLELSTHQLIWIYQVYINETGFFWWLDVTILWFDSEFLELIHRHRSTSKWLWTWKNGPNEIHSNFHWFHKNPLNLSNKHDVAKFNDSFRRIGDDWNLSSKDNDPVLLQRQYLSTNSNRNKNNMLW